MACGIYTTINISQTQTLIITMGLSHCKGNEGGVGCRCLQKVSWHWAAFRPPHTGQLRDDLGRDCNSIFLTTGIFKIELMCGTLVLCREPGFIPRGLENKATHVVEIWQWLAFLSGIKPHQISEKRKKTLYKEKVSKGVCEAIHHLWIHTAAPSCSVLFFYCFLGWGRKIMVSLCRGPCHCLLPLL